jgi:hypothetical protein
MALIRKHGRTIILIVVAIAALVGGSFLLRLLNIDPNAFAAAASAAAAIAAFASARESSTTARNAIRALSLTSKPKPRVELLENDGDLTLRIINESVHPIDHAEVAWTLRNGVTGSRTLPTLAGHQIVSEGLSWGSRGPSYPSIVITPNPGRVSGVDKVTLDYWGTNGPIGWRQNFETNHVFTSTGDTGGYSVSTLPISETELD